jgi:hypothetical protein
MHSTLNPKPIDDPHDFVVVAPDDVRVAPAEEELSNLLRQAARHHSGPQTRTQSGLLADAAVPAVDTTFRPAVANNAQLLGQRRSIARRVLRAFGALLLAACIGVAGIAWQSDAAKKMIAKVATQLFLIASLSPEKSGPPAQPAAPAVVAADANGASPQLAPVAQTAPQAVAPPAAAPSADSAQLQSMARDLASAGQEIEQLKASIEQLKASQQQMSRDMAKSSENKASENRASENKASEQSARPRMSALPPRPAAARARKPIAPYPPPQAAAASTLPPTAAPYYAPRQIEPPPQTTAPPLTDPELASVPRPPMPVR